jgi:hypothetical protein
MRKRKEENEGKQTLDTMIYPIVSIGNKPPLVHIVKALTESIIFRSPSLFRDSP